VNNQIYFDTNGRIVEVTPGLGNVWIVARRARSGAHHRVKSPDLPARPNAALCQRDLDLYARRKHWLADCTNNPLFRTGERV
jgi:hypothetical protein